MLEAKSIGLYAPVYWGGGAELLEEGACQTPASALLGASGNSVISAHVNTFFHDLNQLKVGDTVTAYTTYGKFTYEVTEQITFDASDKSYLKKTDDERLTLYTCEMQLLGSSSKRVGVVCKLTDKAFYTDAGTSAERRQPMSKATTSGMGKGGLLLRLILSILLVFSLLGTVGSAVGVSVLCGPSQLISQMHRHDAGQKVYDSLNTRFQNDYNTTAVPAEVYMDTISVDWLEQCMENKVTALYGKGSGDIDFSALESSITDYFEKYAEENNCAKDDTYNEKLRETIDNGEKVISDATDLLRTETLQKSGYLSKLHKLRTLTFAGEGVCGVLTVLLLLLLRNRYWIGTGCFGAGALLTAGAGVIFGTGVIHRFVLKEAAVYAVVTGTMTALTTAVLVSGIVLLALGVVLLALHLKGQRSEKAE